MSPHEQATDAVIFPRTSGHSTGIEIKQDSQLLTTTNHIYERIIFRSQGFITSAGSNMPVRQGSGPLTIIYF